MLEAVEVKGLFSRFDYRIALKEEGITVLTGPNGFGKSTMFSLIEAVANGTTAAFMETPFAEFSLFFSDGESFTATRKGDVVYCGGERLERGGAAEILKSAAASLGAVKTVGNRRLLGGAIKDGRALNEYLDELRRIPERIKEDCEKNPEDVRIALFKKLLDERLVFKNALVGGARGLAFYSGDGKVLEFSDLSAGEIQLTAFYYELLLRTPEGALLLIDEPETSMHVVWQLALVEDLKSVLAALGGAQAIVATHSPQILGGHRDLQVDLGEQYGR